MLWSRKKKPDDAASEATADTASDSPVENDSEGSETPPEITAPEVTDQQGSESEPAASKDENRAGYKFRFTGSGRQRW